jgi:hypothetical protein
MAPRNTSNGDSFRIELQEAIATFRHQIAQLSQLLGIIITADAILLGYAFARAAFGKNPNDVGSVIVL